MGIDGEVQQGEAAVKGAAVGVWLISLSSCMRKIDMIQGDGPALET